ncbi:hypothetical protein [Rodentibacter pneumotropicus]|nr:hypothetical protein [Rodentibacter pneumotropicus]
MDLKELVSYTLSILSFIYLIKRYYLDSFQKREIQDFEQINKYFINNRYKDFESESLLVKDMLCNTVSHFKGVNYDLVKHILETKNISLFDFLKIRKLQKIGYLKPNIERNKNYKKGIDYRVKLCFWYALFALYVYLFIYIVDSFLRINDTFIIMSIVMGFIAPLEIVLLFYTDKITSSNNAIKWYEKNKNELIKAKILLLGK